MQEPDSSVKYATPGERLTHLLDKIGFESGRGRTRALYNRLVDSSVEEFSDLKFGTVRSWFHNHAPPMRKVTSIIDLLSENYSFKPDKEQVSVWWKVGGFYPYDTLEPTLDSRKVGSYVASTIQEHSRSNDLSISRLLEQEIQDAVMAMCNDFADPNLTECPVQYIDMLIKGKLDSLK